uniref:Uncharacterized protein n=1 Tax=Anguilla anguilla TaxID=7936 RepID=A0A0E9PH16_ANGAN
MQGLTRHYKKEEVLFFFEPVVT